MVEAALPSVVRRRLSSAGLAAPVACLLLATFLVVGSAWAVTPTVRPDRQDIEAILIDAGYSGVSTLRLVDGRWIGIGAHDGLVVSFVVDAATGRILTEVQTR